MIYLFSQQLAFVHKTQPNLSHCQVMFILQQCLFYRLKDQEMLLGDVLKGCYNRFFH